MNNIRMLLLDMDGTLLTDDKRITARTIQALKQAHDEGYWIGLASGRPRWLLERSIKEYQIEAWIDGCIGLNGAHIWDRGLNRFESLSPLSRADVEMIVAGSTAVAANAVAYDEVGVYAREWDETSQWMADYFAVPQYLFHDMPSEYPYMKIEIIRKAPAYTEAEWDVLRSIGSDSCEAIASSEASMEYLPIGRSKCTGAQLLASWHNWALEQIVAFGDQDNDVPLLKAAGIGVCMANGSSNAKAAAKYITGSNEEDGVAQWIETHVLDRTSPSGL